MHYLWQHLEHLLAVYDGKLPLHHYLKSYFKAQPKLGSRDRRGLSDAVYAWYRAGKAVRHLSADEREQRLAAMKLCRLRPKAFAAYLDDREIQADLQAIFPYDILFSEGMMAGEWRASMLVQPRLFLRIRKDKPGVSARLSKEGITHEWISDSCLALPNGTRLEGVLPDDAYVVQDASSQATGAFLNPVRNESWWDVCSGAGGKSLMLKDAQPDVPLLVSDIRASILQNLAARFRLYHHRQPEAKVMDARHAEELARQLGGRRFDGIVCDVPCTGSGTWARTPEACYFFQPETLAGYSERQQAILSNAAEYLRPAGRIIYITCSVFREENEGVTESVAKAKGLVIVSSQLINGIAIGADSLFVAVLRKA